MTLYIFMVSGEQSESFVVVAPDLYTAYLLLPMVRFNTNQEFYGEPEIAIKLSEISKAELLHTTYLHL